MERWASALMAVAALTGAAGVIEAAAAAHGTDDRLLQTSANFLLLTAASTMGIVACALGLRRRVACFLVAASFLLAGCLLFCGDLTVRVFFAHGLFAFAAPTGGTMMILSWLAAALIAVSSWFGRSEN